MQKKSFKNKLLKIFLIMMCKKYTNEFIFAQMTTFYHMSLVSAIYSYHNQVLLEDSNITY